MENRENEAWEELYVAAVLESDLTKISDRVEAARNALRERWQSLHRTPLANKRELERVVDAMRTLNLLRETELRTPTETELRAPA